MLINEMMPVRVMNQAPQQSGAWFQERLGCLTASRMREAMSFKRDGTETQERYKLKIEIVAERMTSILVPHFLTDAMQWGLDHEEEAKLALQQVLDIDLQPCGFFPHPTIENLGATPDALIRTDAVLEVKAPTTKTHISWLLANEVPTEYKPQLLLQLICTGRRVAHFLSYDPRVQKRPMLYKLFAPTQQERDKVEQAAIQFLNEVEELFERVSTSRSGG